MIKSFLSFLFAGVLFVNTSAQQKDVGSWTTINLKKNISQKWSAFSEFQMRSLSIYNRFYYYEIKAGASYVLNKKFQFTLGTGFYSTFEEGIDFDNYEKQNEFRIWEQFVFKQKISILNLEHRIRVEQQFKENYDNRFRYRFGTSIPINHSEIKAKTFYATINDEIFFNEDFSYFSRNRFYAGLGYKFSEKFSFQIGVLRQVDFSDAYTRRKNYLFTSWSVGL